MMLRASAQTSGEDVHLAVVVDGGSATTSVPGDQALLAFAEVALHDDAEAIAKARQQVRSDLGEAAMIDAAGVIANFQRMVRIADGTGIPLDAPMDALTADLRVELGIKHYGAEGSGRLLSNSNSSTSKPNSSSPCR